MRRALLGGATTTAILQDLGSLALLALGLLLAGSAAFLYGLRHARREGTLGQY
jgi:hypothetical protein